MHFQLFSQNYAEIAPPADVENSIVRLHKANISYCYCNLVQFMPNKITFLKLSFLTEIPKVADRREVQALKMR